MKSELIVQYKVQEINNPQMDCGTSLNDVSNLQLHHCADSIWQLNIINHKERERRHYYYRVGLCVYVCMSVQIRVAWPGTCMCKPETADLLALVKFISAVRQAVRSIHIAQVHHHFCPPSPFDCWCVYPGQFVSCHSSILHSPSVYQSPATTWI